MIQAGVNQNFVEMLCALSDAGADYLIVGGYAFAAHHQPLATKDLDIWWPRRIFVEIDGRQHPVIGRDEFIRNKRGVARPQDLVDVDVLTKKR